MKPICDKSKFDFDKHSSQKLFLSSLKALQIFLLGKIALVKHVILAISTLSSIKLFSPLIKRRRKKKFSMSEGEHRGDKLSSGKIQNKLVKNNKSSVLLLRLIKLG
jgi:hypothetical protein